MKLDGRPLARISVATGESDRHSDHCITIPRKTPRSPLAAIDCPSQVVMSFLYFSCLSVSSTRLSRNSRKHDCSTRYTLVLVCTRFCAQAELERWIPDVFVDKILGRECGIRTWYHSTGYTGFASVDPDNEPRLSVHPGSAALSTLFGLRLQLQATIDHGHPTSFKILILDSSSLPQHPALAGNVFEIVSMKFEIASEDHLRFQILSCSVWDSRLQQFKTLKTQKSVSTCYIGAYVCTFFHSCPIDGNPFMLLCHCTQIYAELFAWLDAYQKRQATLLARVTRTRTPYNPTPRLEGQTSLDWFLTDFENHCASRSATPSRPGLSPAPPFSSSPSPLPPRPAAAAAVASAPPFPSHLFPSPFRTPALPSPAASPIPALPPCNIGSATAMAMDVFPVCPPSFPRPPLPCSQPCDSPKTL